MPFQTFVIMTFLVIVKIADNLFLSNNSAVGKQTEKTANLISLDVQFGTH